MYVSMEQITVMKKPEKTGKQNAMRVSLNLSASNNLLREILCRSGFASGCEYRICSDVSNL